MLGTRRRNGNRPASKPEAPRPDNLFVLEPEAEPDEPLRPLAAPDAVVAGLFEGVFRSARNHLIEADGPLAAEVWGSALLAVWADEGTDGSDLGFADALVRHAKYVSTPEALAVLCALAAVAPARIATRARTVVADLAQSGLQRPAWAENAGLAQATEAWIGTDAYGDQDILILAFEYPGRGALPVEGAHTICVLIDHNEGGAAKDAYPAAALPATLARWRDAQTNGIRIQPLSLSEAAARLEDALTAAQFAAGHIGNGRGANGGRLVELRALLSARLGILPAPERAAAGEVDLAERQSLVSDFLESAEAGGLLYEPAAVDICERLVAFRCDDGDGDPLRWSPTLVVRCLMDYLPACDELDRSQLGLVPDVLTAWVRYAGRKKALAADPLGRTIAAIEMCRPDFLEVMAGDDKPGPGLAVAG